MTNVIENLLVNSYNENVRKIRKVRNMESLKDKLLSAKVTSKGQITIPKEVRDNLNIKEGDVIMFYPKDGLYFFGGFEEIWNKELNDKAKEKGFNSWSELEELIERSREETYQENKTR